MNTNNTKRSFLKGLIAATIGSAFLPATAGLRTPTMSSKKSLDNVSVAVSTENVPPTISSKLSLDNVAVGALFWHDKKLFVKLSDSEIDQVYPAIATYA
jgi:hypothetical protein